MLDSTLHKDLNMQTFMSKVTQF